ncbi:hypothetical protein NP493_391g02035 [Ridgeia piscesae]|uniref:Transgelin n=1 Tax=Ridgeia piscesae TaxID=27915 RepID=A0AAD9L1Y8_RIDPI|nr:hypothetical protein NP493_391g02035 [Ridgeia piscesae]
MMTGCDEIPEEPEQINGSHDNFHELLYDGLLLSKLIDALYPGHINWNDRTFQTPKIEAMRMMREKERIASFNNLVQEFGVPDSFVFPTDSLHDRGVLNLAQVCSCIRALGIEAQTKPDYRGPENYWPKKSMRNIRSFTEEQLRAGDSIIGLQAGSNKGASQAGLTMGKQRMILD